MAGLSGTEPVLVALSGGADSVFLLHAVARARPRPKVLAVHVEHGLRGAEGAGDSAFCARLCARLGIPFARRVLELDGSAGNLEARAREGRYRVLLEEATTAGIGTVLTGHHEDDALETLLLRWLRGSYLPGLPGLKARNMLRAGARRQQPVAVVRPLLAMRREEVRRVLSDQRMEWREDSSNRSARFTRNRIRHDLLPQIREACGPRGVEGLRAFAHAVENLEDELASRTAHVCWEPPVHAAARRSSREAHLGGTLKRRALTQLTPALQRRAFWRLISEGTGHAPSRSLLALLQDDLARGRTRRHSLPGGWSLQLRADALHLSPPPTSRASAPAPQLETGPQLSLFAGGVDDAPHGLALPIPGRVELGDGRAISAEIVEVPPGRSVPRDEVEVELRSDRLPGALRVRGAEPGDRFHALGAPGSRPVRRFLADAGIPREERGRVPLVFAGSELIWVAGIRPGEGRRVSTDTPRRLRLRLEGAAPTATDAGAGLCGESTH